MKVLEAVEYPKAYVYRIHLDPAKTKVVKPAKVDKAGKVIEPEEIGPDPEYVMEFRWPKIQNLEVSKLEMKRLCEHRLAQLVGTPMADQGKNL